MSLEGYDSGWWLWRRRKSHPGRGGGLVGRRGELNQRGELGRDKRFH